MALSGNIPIQMGPRGTGAIQMEGSARANNPSVNELHRDVISKARRMGITHEVRDLHDQIEELSRLVQIKNYELDALEMLAMESDDENIIVLREQLFATVKLVHNDELSELIIDFKSQPQEDVGFDIGISSPKKQSLIDRARQWYYKRREIRRQLKHTRKMLTRQLG